MIQAIIIEDEEKVRAGLKKILAIVSPFVQIKAETAYVSEAIKLIKQHSPDLIFLDIELEDGNGFDILNTLKHYDFQIIFTTAYNRHAIKAFKYSALDYLLKPIDPAELKTAVNKAHENIKQAVAYRELVEVLQNNMQQRDKKIVLKTAGERYIINLRNIVRLEADGAYSTIITTDAKYIMSRNIKYYENLLDTDFFRPHQSHLINKNHITSLKNDRLIMSNGDIVPISSRRRKEISGLLQNN